MFKNSISQENSLKNITYSIGYQTKNKDTFMPLNVPDIHDCQVNWDINDTYVDGYIIFEDKAGIFANIPPHNTMIFKIEGVDAFNVIGKNIFIVTKIEHHKNDTFTTVFKLEFVDVVYYYMLNSYIGRGYTSTTVSNIIKDYLTDPKLIGNIKRQFPIINIEDTDVIYENIVVPVHKPFLSFVHNREIFDSFLFYSTRLGTALVKSNNIPNRYVKLVEGDKGAIFKMHNPDVPLDVNNPFLIHKIQILSLDLLSTCVNLPDTIVSNFNYITKKIENKIVVHSNIATDMDSSSYLISYARTNGVKSVEMPNNAGYGAFSRIYSTNALENILIEIEVTGSFAYNLLFKVGIDIPSNIQIEKNISTNFILSGEYVILKIVDKFKSGHFTQILTLGRAGIKEK
jgi:hypothetical protein